MTALPRKLKNDAIAEALCEIRFECSESEQVAELVVGKLADNERWADYSGARLPAAEMPAAIRVQLPDMKHQPLTELRSPDRSRVVKIGTHVLSYHAMAPYPGWEVLAVEINEVIDYVFKRLRQFRATRLGVRYVNLLTNDEHGISQLSDLNCKLLIRDARVTGPQVLSFQDNLSQTHVAMIRVASPEFVAGAVTKPFSALIDVDVFTPPDRSIDSPTAAKAWISEAHQLEKNQFFRLLKDETIENLKVD